MYYFITITFIISFYSEIINDKKVNLISNEIKKSQLALNNTNQTRKELVEAQNVLFQSMLGGNNSTNYYKSIAKLNDNVDSLNTYTKANYDLISSLKLYDTLRNSNLYSKNKIDSIITNNDILYATKNNKIFNLNEYDFKEVLKNINVDTYIMVDSVAKKGFLSRIGDAFKGEVPIQKEKVNVVITLKFGNRITNGNVERQIQNVFKA